MIKLATLEDFDLIKEMADKFIKTSPYAQYASDEDMDMTIRQLLLANRMDAIIILEDGGMLAGAKSKFPFGPHFIATEVGWWVEPEYRGNGVGKKLIEYFEMWAKVAGCSFCSMGSLDEDLAEFYEKNGYKLYERAYLKVL